MHALPFRLTRLRGEGMTCWTYVFPHSFKTSQDTQLAFRCKFMTKTNFSRLFRVRVHLTLCDQRRIEAREKPSITNLLIYAVPAISVVVTCWRYTETPQVAPSLQVSPLIEKRSNHNQPHGF